MAKDTFVVTWFYNAPVNTDYSLHGPFSSFEEADVWGHARLRHTFGKYDVIKVIPP